jgi:sulfite exporter TauE/SafE
MGPARVAALAATVLLIAAGLGLWADADWWRPAAVAGLATSLGLMIVYFDRWFLFIEAVNAALIVGILWLSWPSPAMVGT